MEENPYSAPESEIIEDTNKHVSEIVLANRGTRLLAAIIDSIILMAICLPLFWVFELVDFKTGETNITTQVLGAVIGVAIYLIVNGKLLLSKGQTVGKKIMKIQVLNADTKTIPSATDILAKRYLIFAVIGQIPMANILHLIDALLIFRSSKKCLHDDFANTIVVKA